MLGPQIPTIAAGSVGSNLMASGSMPHKPEKSNLPGVKVMPQLDGPCGSRKKPKVSLLLFIGRQITN